MSVAALDIPLSPGFARCKAPRTSSLLNPMQIADIVQKICKGVMWSLIMQNQPRIISLFILVQLFWGKNAPGFLQSKVPLKECLYLLYELLCLLWFQVLLCQNTIYLLLNCTIGVDGCNLQSLGFWEVCKGVERG